MGEKIYGKHSIEEGLKLAPAGSTLYVSRAVGKGYADIERKAMLTGKVAIKRISPVEMDTMVSGADHRGLVLDLGGARRSGGNLIVLTVEQFIESLAPEQGALVLFLDEITDPHNLGAILRSADQFSVDLVVVPERRSAQANETVTKVSSGAAQYVPLAVVTNMNREVKLLKDNGFWIYGADMGGPSSFETKFPKRTALIMGSEGSGIRQMTRSLCDYIVSIPMTGHIDSLNVSVATGILLYEFRRQICK
ncbi:MAG: 23S rRNA (guanosine(2251)-2'-O)-methyltransferase RlmB [Sphaerochaetaceae bacterium]